MIGRQIRGEFLSSAEQTSSASLSSRKTKRLLTADVGKRGRRRRRRPSRRHRDGRLLFKSDPVTSITSMAPCTENYQSMDVALG